MIRSPTTTVEAERFQARRRDEEAKTAVLGEPMPVPDVISTTGGLCKI